MEVSIEGTRFHLDGVPTYEGRTWDGRSIAGLLMNSRMIQAVFDDACPDTRRLWAYPDTGLWDPDRNTDEFCDQLPTYRAHGLLAVTVGLQGGGSIYRPEVYERYENSAYEPDGRFRQPYFDRLLRVIRAADRAGVTVIVNYFYFKQVSRIPDDAVIASLVERVTDWLLRTGHRNILVDLANESGYWWHRRIFEPDAIHRLIDAAKSTALEGRRLLVGCSTAGGEQIPEPRWMDAEDFTLPHGNGLTPHGLAEKIRRIRETDAYRRRPRPLLVNEDSIFVENMEAAVREGASWGFYCQGYGSGYRDRMDWTTQEREKEYDALSGFQTVPVNWSINTPVKRRFFERLREITGGAA